MSKRFTNFANTNQKQKVIFLKKKVMINLNSNAAMTAQTESTEKRSISNEQVINKGKMYIDFCDDMEKVLLGLAEDFYHEDWISCESLEDYLETIEGNQVDMECLIEARENINDVRSELEYVMENDDCKCSEDLEEDLDYMFKKVDLDLITGGGIRFSNLWDNLVYLYRKAEIQGMTVVFAAEKIKEIRYISDSLRKNIDEFLNNFEI